MSLCLLNQKVISCKNGTTFTFVNAQKLECAIQWSRYLSANAQNADPKRATSKTCLKKSWAFDWGERGKQKLDCG
jgi:hypothetical protein